MSLKRVLLIFSCSYAYNGLFINGVPLKLLGFLDFVLLIGLPYVPLVLPVAVLVHLMFGRIRILIKADDRQIIIHGRNQNECLGLQKKIFRSTLKEIQKQVPVAERIHRSYLVNPGRIECFDGNSRKRVARIEQVNHNIPVSSSNPV